METIERKLKVSNLKGVEDWNFKYYCSWLTLCGVLYVHGASKLYDTVHSAGIKYFQDGKGSDQDFFEAVNHGAVSAIRYCAVDSNRCHREWDFLGVRKYNKFIKELSKLL